ncbi:hypothetical protein [Aquiflexum lacus]|uniref:hypothetical protein n=1 Tax=Aquiflexum lacus TaxID=2483805 RepID=UPI001E2A5ABF|nr:hypothetical protein [Aquiflexum lacus]
MIPSFYKTMISFFKFAFFSAILLSASINEVFADSNSGQVKSIDEVYIKLDIREGNLEVILNAIEKKTDYSFFYTENNIRDNEKI